MIESIKVERQQLVNEIDRLFERLSMLDGTLETYGVKATSPRKSKHAQKTATEANKLNRIKVGATPEYQGLTQGDAAYVYLFEKGEKAHVNEIAEVLLDRGLRVRDDAKELSREDLLFRIKQSLVSALLRDETRFRRVGRNTFALVENLPNSEVQPELEKGTVSMTR